VELPERERGGGAVEEAGDWETAEAGASEEVGAGREVSESEKSGKSAHEREGVEGVGRDG
jgi:hypothetical protein